VGSQEVGGLEEINISRLKGGQRRTEMKLAALSVWGGEMKILPGGLGQGRGGAQTRNHE